MSSSYSYSGSPSLSSGTYTRSYSANGVQVSTTYTPYNFFNTFGSKTSVSNKLNYAKAGLGISPTSTTFTNTYNPVTNTTSGGNQFRMVCTYSSYYARDPYQEYSLVANTIAGLYDVHIKNTSSATYIDSAEYENSSWTATTDTINGRVLIGTTGNTNAVAVSDNSVDINNHVLPSTDNAFSLGAPDKKWLSLYVDTVIADNYIGLPDSGGSSGGSGSSSELAYNGTTKVMATSTGATVYGSILPSSNNSYSLGNTSNAWQNAYVYSNSGYYYEIGSDTSSDNVSEPVIRPSASGWGYLGTPSYHIYNAYIDNIYVTSSGTSLDSYISSHSGSSSIYTTIKGTNSGALYFFKLSIKNNSSSSVIVPRGTSLSDSSYFSSSKLSIQSWEERVDDTSASYGTSSFSGTYYTLLRFTISSSTTSNVYVPCVKG